MTRAPMSCNAPILPSLAVAVKISSPPPRSNLASTRNFQAAVHHYSQWLSGGFHVAHREFGVVRQHGADPGEYRAGTCPQPVPVASRRLARNPLAGAIIERGLAVETCGNLHSYPRPLARHAGDKPDIQRRGFRLHQTGLHFYSGLSRAWRNLRLIPGDLGPALPPRALQRPL